METIEDLKQEATELGLTFNAKIGAAKLKEKIEAFYESQETSGQEIEEAVEQIEQAEEKVVVTGKPSKAERIKLAREKAEKTRIVIITDNDQRVNSQTSSCKINCSNMYFDLGQMTLPLNKAVEVRQGHIDSLKEVKIPHHVKDEASGLAMVVMRKRYSVSYEN